MSNFKFLKEVNKNLYDIAFEAEKLYRDEYFEQCIAQTRRFGENICRDILKNKAVGNDTFDQMLSTLKDKPNQNPREKELLDDLYFLKKEGNASVHAQSVNKNAITALECLKRAFEISINYALYKSGPNSKIDALQFDEELMILGVKNKKTTLKEKYVEKKQKEQQKENKFSESTKKLQKMQKKHNKPNKPQKNIKKGFIRHFIETIIAAGIVALFIFFTN